jgi:hypothetical protein
MKPAAPAIAPGRKTAWIFDYCRRQFVEVPAALVRKSEPKKR